MTIPYGRGPDPFPLILYRNSHKQPDKLAGGTLQSAAARLSPDLDDGLTSQVSPSTVSEGTVLAF
jgi:hypothetical protein